MKMTEGEYNFTKDLPKGEFGEEVMIKFMESLGFKLISRCKDKKYDFKMNYEGFEYDYEIKTDMYCKPNNDTGNLVVEIKSWGKPSGISVTTADYFVTYYPHLGEIWNIKTEDLRKLISENDIKLKEGKGDKGSGTAFHVVNRVIYRKHFKVYTIDKV